MKSLPRIGMLVQVGPVEVDQAVRIGGKVRRHPVEDHADALLMQMIDEVHEVLRRAIARGRGEISGGLIAPGPVERVLGDRHQLDVREPHAQHVVGKLRRDFPVVGQLSVLAPPGAQVQLVDGHRRVEAVAPGTRFHPPTVLPLPLERPDSRSRGRRQLGIKTDGIGLITGVTVHRRGDPILVGLPALGGRHAALPDAGAVRAWRERILVRPPAVPVADHRDLGGIRRPNSERGSAAFEQMTSELVIQPSVASLPEQIDIVLGQQSDLLQMKSKTHRASKHKGRSTAQL